MARLKILHDVDCSPDHNTTHTYRAGEVHEVGSELMPEWLAASLLTTREPDQHHTAAPSQFDHPHQVGVQMAEETKDKVNVLGGGIVTQTQKAQPLFAAKKIVATDRFVREIHE
jgi:hypothetical protein